MLDKFSELFSHYGILLCEFLLGITVLTWLISKKTAISLWTSVKAEIMKIYHSVFGIKDSQKLTQTIEIVKTPGNH